MMKPRAENLPKVHMAAFGKHPGWDDHIEDIGLTSPSLVLARRVMYSEGIAGNIDSGSWDRLEDVKRLPSFKHHFYWRRPEGWLVGRMWSSRDGKGRSKYPMIVCGLVEGVPAAWAFERILPKLAAIEARVTQTSSAEMVRLAIGEAKRDLESELAPTSDGSPDGSAIASSDLLLLQRLVDHPGLQPGGDPLVGFERVAYEIECRSDFKSKFPNRWPLSLEIT
jgi:hypothetical protein